MQEFLNLNLNDLLPQSLNNVSSQEHLINKPLGEMINNCQQNNQNLKIKVNLYPIKLDQALTMVLEEEIKML